MTERDDVIRVVQTIPVGRVAHYGAIGHACSPILSGLLVGRRLHDVPADVPWWRVVARDGHLPISKRDPQMAMDQKLRLEEEGVRFLDEKVEPEFFWEP